MTNQYKEQLSPQSHLFTVWVLPNQIVKHASDLPYLRGVLWGLPPTPRSQVAVNCRHQNTDGSSEIDTLPSERSCFL